MYPRQKNNALARATKVVLGASVLILIGAIDFCIMVSQGSGAGFKNLTTAKCGGSGGTGGSGRTSGSGGSSGSGNPLSLPK